MPFSARPYLGTYLKLSGVRVLANDPLESAYQDCVAHIANNGTRLSDEEAAIVLEDAYVPQYELRNPGIRNWFGETDAWWFDNVRTNIERLGSPVSKAVAMSLGMKVGDYVFSFDDETRRLRQPLSRVFERLRKIDDEPADNGEENRCRCDNPMDFTAESYTDLFYLKLPAARRRSMKGALGTGAWREVWVRGEDGFWPDLEESFRGKLGSHVETKSQYLEMISNALETASHIPLWAIEHVEDGFIQTHDVVEAVAGLRRVDTVYTKDFSELSGVKAVMITA